MSRETVRALAIGMVLGASATGLISTVRAQAPATESAYMLSSNGVISFIVEGRQVARIDAQGLSINGSVTHSGALISTNGTPAISLGDVKDGDR